MEKLTVGIMSLGGEDTTMFDQELVSFCYPFPVRPWNIHKVDVLLIPNFEGFNVMLPPFGRFEIPNVFFPNWPNMAEYLYQTADSPGGLFSHQKTTIIAEGNAACLVMAAMRQQIKLETHHGKVRPVQGCHQAVKYQDNGFWSVEEHKFIGVEVFHSMHTLRKMILAAGADDDDNILEGVFIS